MLKRCSNMVMPTQLRSAGSSSPNPDPPRRIALGGAQFNAYDRSTFYTREKKGYDGLSRA